MYITHRAVLSSMFILFLVFLIAIREQLVFKVTVIMMSYSVYIMIIITSLPKVIWEMCIATPHGRECTHPLHVLAVQCPLQTSPFTQLRVHYIHTVMPHQSLDISVPNHNLYLKLTLLTVLIPPQPPTSILQA